MAGGGVDLATFRATGLAVHNELRAKHGCGALVLTDALNTKAQAWAEAMAKSDQFRHSTQSDTETRLGENIYWGCPFRGSQEEAKTAVNSFYNEIADYDYAKPGHPKTPGKMIGHFTQIVWRRCSELGLGIALSTKGGVYVCANYDPPGNLIGTYEENVLPVGATPPPKPSPEAVPKLILDLHNTFRAKHDAQPLVISADLNSAALELATSIAKSQDFAYRSGLKHGQNIAVVSEFCPEKAVESWYAQGLKLRPDSTLTPDLCKFAQVVWKGTKTMGVGLALGRPWSCLVVLYDPRGNIVNTFRENVTLPR